MVYRVVTATARLSSCFCRAKTAATETTWRLIGLRRLSTETSASASSQSTADGAVRFSTTRAARTNIDDTLGIPRDKGPTTFNYVLLGFGTVLVSALVYTCITSDASDPTQRFPFNYMETPEALAGVANQTATSNSQQPQQVTASADAAAQSTQS